MSGARLYSASTIEYYAACIRHDMTPVTLCRHRANLSLCFLIMLKLTLNPYTTTNGFKCESVTQPRSNTNLGTDVLDHCAINWFSGNVT